MKTKIIHFTVVLLVLLGINNEVFSQNTGTYNMLVQSDAYVYEETANINNGSSANLIAGRGSEFGYLYRSYLKFENPPVPDDAVIVSATLYVYQHNLTESDYRIKLSKVTESWNENTLTWNNQPENDNRVFIQSKDIANDEGWVEFDLKNTLKEWLDGEINAGLVISADNETGDMVSSSFYSGESSGCTPYINVVYMTWLTVPDSPDAPLCNTTSDETPPDVDLDFSVSPLHLGDQVMISAEASDPQGIHLLQIYRGSTLLGEVTDNSSQTSLSITRNATPVTAGPIMFFAVAYNDRMQCSRISKRLLVEVDGEAPEVSLYHLPENPEMGEPVTFYASAEDPSGIANLSIQVNGFKTFLSIDEGVISVSGSLSVEDAGIYYNPDVTRTVSYSATAYDSEGNHTTYGPHTVLFGSSIGSDDDGDGLDNALEEILGLDENSDDTDGDGLFDSWEVFGLDRDNDGTIDLDLPGLGASPHHKDLFLEIDWLEDDTHSHKPHPWAIQTFINLFQCYGIRAHVDVGNMGGGNAIPHSLGDGITSSKEIIELVAPVHRNPSRFGVFRYALCGHVWSESYGAGMVVIRTEPAGSSTNYDEPYFQARHLIHEIGHTLNLGHGGQSRTGTFETYSLNEDFNII
ncbi:MAG: DNRLRE domain-containing protein, partial [Bacteroidales bacterium]|nr:DNRLRE domain-containing protein [Bacteroidales bacterium]